MARLYCPKEHVLGRRIFIVDRKQIHYLYNVLRLEPKDDVFVFDGQGNEYHCQIKKMSKQTLELEIIKKAATKTQSKSRLSLACALPKKTMFDDIVNKLSQLGVDRIIPMVTEHVIVHWDSTQRLRHLMRWQEIARAASAQSGRNILPVIDSIKELREILSMSKEYDLKLISTLMGKRQNLRDALPCPYPKNILVLVGPEGDFSKEELSKATESGFIPISLGSLVLRVDTAAVAIASFVRLNEDISYGARRAT